jgi:RHS repeat-associated protein
MKKSILLALMIAIGVSGYIVSGCSDSRSPSRGSREGISDINWQYIYDERGRVKEATSPGKLTTRFSYEDDEKSGVTQRVTRQDGQGGKVVYELGALGRCVRMTDPAGSTQYAYDRDGRLTSVRRDGNPGVSYTYDSMNRLSSLSVGGAGAMTISYVYDFLGRLNTIATPRGNITYEYHSGAGRVVRILPNGIRTAYDYRPDGRLKAIVHAGRDSRVLAGFSYTYHPDGLIEQIAEWSPKGERKIAYSYDEVQRLTAVHDSREGKTEFRYDRMGNRLAVKIGERLVDSYAYDWSGKMTRRAGRACKHDVAYNLASCGGAREPQFAYDMMNSLRTATKGDSRVSYYYDGNGHLLARTEQDRQVRFVLNPMSTLWQPVMTQSAGGKSTFYVWTGDTPLMSITGNDVQFLLHDHLGSVRYAADHNGTVIDSYDYSPFGAPRQANTTGSLQPGFAGLFYDTSAHVYLTRARAYDPRTGRFLQIDPQFRIPTGSQKDLSTYVYCGNDPVNFVDRNGFQGEWVWGPENMAWQVIHDPLRIMDERYAKKYWADQSELATSSGEPHWIMSGIAATGWDIVGGLIPGAPANRGQGYAQVGWSFLPGGPGMARTILSSFVNAAEGNYIGACLDQISLGGKVARIRSNSLKYDIFPGRDSQYTFGYALSENVKVSNRLNIESSAIQYFGYAVLAKKVWDNTITDWTKTGTFVAGVTAGSTNFLRGGSLSVRDEMLPSGNKVKRPDDDYAPLGPPSKSDPLWNVIDRNKLDRQGALMPVSGRRDSGGGSAALSPSNVGGVYMRGAGEALKGLGAVSGVSLDENGRLVLLSEGGSQIGLPPLRMEDIAVIFKSVYQSGAPYVSIDPDPKNPEGPIMLVRHDESTARTYPGWVLFEADRVMKGYSLGTDNVTRRKIASGVAGYQSILDMGLSSSSGDGQDRVWERFWIVPAEVKRYQAADSRLSVFDVPLRVNTQRMILKDGKLEPAAGKEPSPAARTFSAWFTKNYDGIARESRSIPAKGSGMQEPVAALAELRRIALLTAIAESLRDRGVPLPAWIQNYPVKPFPVATTTPSITVEASKTRARMIRTHRIFGGVRLAPEDKDIRVVKNSRETEKLGTVVDQKMMSAPSLTPVKLPSGGKDYQAVALPGEDTTDLGSNHMRERDLVVPVERGAAISLTREFNSFFQPSDVWGNGWTMNLPYLEKTRQPVQRVGDQTKYQTGYQLGSPLGSYAESFREVRFVPEMNGKIMAPQKQGGILGLAEATKKNIGVRTTEVIFRDGGEWHFDASGCLVASVAGPEMVIYRRDGARRVTRIEGWYGKNLRADIHIEYDKQGRIVLARGSNKQEVKYAYDGSGKLQCVQRNGGKVEYAYTRGLVAGVKVDGKAVRSYVYDSQGRLIQEGLSSGAQRTFTYQGRRATSVSGNSSDTSEYDSAMRPVRRQDADGTRIQWQYPAKGAVVMSVTPPGSKGYQVTSARDGRQVDWVTAGGVKGGVDHDAAGRIVAVREAGRTVMQQQWHPNGLAGATLYESFAARPRYREDNVLDSVLITPPGNQSQFSQWIEIAYNDLGKPGKIRDYSGAETVIGYGRNGQPATLSSKQGMIQVAYDAMGRPDAIKASWGVQYGYSYDKRTGAVSEIEYVAGKKKARVEFSRGRPVVMEQFDGGKYKLSYDKSQDPRLQGVSAPNDVELKYGYDTDGRIKRVDCDGTYAVKFSYDAKGRLTGLSRVPLL